MASSMEKDMTESARYGLTMMLELRRVKQLRDCTFIIAPESNYGSAAQDVHRLAGTDLEEYCIINMDTNGRWPGIRTNNHNKGNFSNELYHTLHKNQFRPWKNMITCGRTGLQSRKSSWLDLVTQVDRYWKYVKYTKAPNTLDPKPVVRYSGKENNNGRDDWVLCMVLGEAELRYWRTGREFFTHPDNVYCHSEKYKGEKVAQEDLTALFRHMTMF